MIRISLAILATLAVAIALFAVAHGSAPTDDWSPVIYPPQRMPLTFSHAKHLTRGTACTTCHPDATTSRSAVDNLIPTEQQCRACHPIDRSQPDLVVAGAPPARCVACHPGFSPDTAVARVYLTPTPLKFSHAAHAKSSCASCHGDLSKVDLATRAHLPTMSSCLTCHREGTQERRCADCHLAKLGGLLDTDLPQGRLIPRQTGLGDAHGPGFGRDHRQEARQVDATCTACHDRSTCLACHQGVTKPEEFHPGNYVLTHAVEARRGTPDCSACHRAQSFCVACHERSGLGLRGNRGVLRRRAYDRVPPDGLGVAHRRHQSPRRRGAPEYRRVRVVSSRERLSRLPQRRSLGSPCVPRTLAGGAEAHAARRSIAATVGCA
jgi:hypothetical protein